MTDEYSPFSGSHHRDKAMPVRIERVWWLQSSSGKVLSCGLYLHPYGVDPIEALPLLPHDGLQITPQASGFSLAPLPHVENDLSKQSHVVRVRL